MTAPTTLDRLTVQQIQKDVRAALAGVCEKYGLTITKNNANYDVAEVRVAVTLRIAGEDASRAEFAKYCAMYGLKPEHFGATITSRGSAFTICGINARSRTKPIIASRDGKEYIFDDAAVRRILGCQYDWEKGTVAALRGVAP